MSSTSEAQRDPVGAVLRAVRRAGVLGPGERPLLAMVSGGRDSVCLLDVAVTLLGRDRVRALHVDYGLRPESSADAAHVADLCARLDVPLQLVTASRPEAGNLQAWARDVRYAEAAKLAEADDAQIATGHTATDQVETVLYRLAASPGRRALLGMRAAEGRLIRPLLSVTREQTAAYCAARGLPWREDASNQDLLYARARVRRGLAAALADIHPAAHANLLRTVALLGEEAAVLDELVDATLAGRDRIDVRRLAELPPALGRLVAVRLAEDATGTLAPAAGTRLTELLELGRGGGSAALDLGGGVRAIVEYGVLRFSAEREEPVPHPVALQVPGQVTFGSWEVACELGGPATDDDDAPALLDADALGPALTVRAWRVGDRMQPVGLGGTKTLSDLFTDRRLPRARRSTIPVIESHGAVAWIPGIATGAAFAVTDSTRRVARLSAQHTSWPARAAALPRPGRRAPDPHRSPLYTARARMAEPTSIRVAPAPATHDGAPERAPGAAPEPGPAPEPRPGGWSGERDPAIGEVMVTAERLQQRVRELGEAISRDYAGRRLLLVGVLKGAVFFLSDLMRWIEIPVEVDFMAVASYGSATDSSGVVRILKDLDTAIEGRDVLIVEDIVDSGLTLQYLLRNLGSRNPRSLEVCALLTKPDRRKVELPTRYVGFEIPDQFVIGYGLDHAERYRNLPFVAALRQT